MTAHPDVLAARAAIMTARPETLLKHPERAERGSGGPVLSTVSRCCMGAEGAKRRRLIDAPAQRPMMGRMSAAAPKQQQSWGSLLAGSASYLLWGLFPIYWQWLKAVDATELIAHRVVWSLVFLLLIVAAQRRLAEFGAGLRNGANLRVHAMSGALLSVNWLVYVWGTNNGHVIECSLGYFLVPLINVALGRFLLHERLRHAQLAAIVLAAAGVGVMIWQLGRAPWIALSLAVTFGLYGLLRKRSKLGPLMGLSVETTLLLPVAGGFLLWEFSRGTGALGKVDTTTTWTIFSTGVVTAVPLLLFAKGARGLRMITLGLLQYLAPTCQFLLGWLMFHEPLSQARAGAFALIWAGLAVYSIDAVVASRRTSSE